MIIFFYRACILPAKFVMEIKLIFLSMRIKRVHHLYPKMTPQTTNSDLLECFNRCSPNQTSERTVDSIVLDGAVLVNFLKSSFTCEPFSDYSECVFIPYTVSAAN